MTPYVGESELIVCLRLPDPSGALVHRAEYCHGIIAVSRETPLTFHEASRCSKFRKIAKAGSSP